MPIISSKIHDLKLRHARTKQKRAALHMLTLSGVIRPGHSELRYETPLARMTALDSESPSLQQSQTHAIPLPCGNRTSQPASPQPGTTSAASPPPSSSSRKNQSSFSGTSKWTPEPSHPLPRVFLAPPREWLVPPIGPEVRSRLDCWSSYDHRRHRT